MALINPSTLYSGGNVKLDSTPYLRVAMQQRARKQALDEAATQYFTKLPEKLNTAGVRDQDMQDPAGNGGIQNDIDNWGADWATNKGAILKGGIAQQQHMANFERIRQKIQASKDVAKEELTAGKAALTPNGWKQREDDIPILHNISKSIYDPTGYKEDGVTRYHINDLSLGAAPFTSQLQLQHNKAIENGVVPEKLPGDTGVLDDVAKKVTYNYGYTPEKITKLAQNAIQDVTSNRTLKYHYEDMLHDPQAVETASKALQSEYDKTHKDGQKVIVDTPEEMAAGLTIAKYSDLKVPKTFTDVASIEQFKKSQQARSFAEREKMAYLNDRLIRNRDKVRAQASQYNIPDVYGSIDQQPVVEVPSLVGDNIKLKDVSSYTNEQLDDAFGKKDKYGQRQHPLLESNGKSYVKVDNDGHITDAKDKKIDPAEVFQRTFSRLHTSTAAQAKGTVKPIIQPTQSPKPKKMKFD